MKLERSSGILLHPTSLPSPDGIGDLGPEAFRWIDFLHASGTQMWQILPLGPTGYGDSPYQCFSAFAGNPFLVSPILLLESGLLKPSDVRQRPEFPETSVDFGPVIEWKNHLLDLAYENYLHLRSADITTQFKQFEVENSEWLDDYGLFMAIKESQGGQPWSDWPKALKFREPAALEQVRQELGTLIEKVKFSQFLFNQQWQNLKNYAHSKDILIIGDMPFVIAFDSADTWASPSLFLMDESLTPTMVAGVPPDYFSATGQLWGNPLYDWEAHERDDYLWWTRRVQQTLKTVDLIRLDHFRGFAGYYRIPADAKTAEIGAWVPGPGKSLFEAMRKKIGDLPFIAEDLGVITPDVIELRDHYGFPGMKLLQFAFWENADHEFLPHNYPVNCVAYTGTHDNDTSKSWFEKAPEHERRFCASLLGYHTRDIAHEMIRAVWQSVALVAVAPMQDFLRLGGWARMNLPASTSGNWLWRMKPNALTDELVEWIKEINITYDRASDGKNWLAKQYFSTK